MYILILLMLTTLAIVWDVIYSKRKKYHDQLVDAPAWIDVINELKSVVLASFVDSSKWLKNVSVCRNPVCHFLGSGPHVLGKVLWFVHSPFNR
jgi:hypothetical protein